MFRVWKARFLSYLVRDHWISPNIMCGAYAYSIYHWWYVPVYRIYFCCVWYLFQIDRIRYVLSSYLRCRLKKVGYTKSFSHYLSSDLIIRLQYKAECSNHFKYLDYFRLRNLQTMYWSRRVTEKKRMSVISLQRNSHLQKSIVLLYCLNSNVDIPRISSEERNIIWCPEMSISMVISLP